MKYKIIILLLHLASLKMLFMFITTSSATEYHYPFTLSLCMKSQKREKIDAKSIIENTFHSFLNTLAISHGSIQPDTHIDKVVTLSFIYRYNDVIYPPGSLPNMIMH